MVSPMRTSQVEPPRPDPRTATRWTPRRAAITEYNPEKARALLADAGYAGGFKVKLNTPDTGYLGAACLCPGVGSNALARRHRHEVERVLPRSVFVKSWFAGEYGFAINSYGGTNLEPDRSILAVLHSKSEGGDGGVQNGGRFVNPKIDFYYLLGSREMDRDLRVAYYRAAQEAAVQDVNLIMTHRPRLLWGMRKGLQFRQRIPPRSISPVERNPRRQLTLVDPVDRGDVAGLARHQVCRVRRLSSHPASPLVRWLPSFPGDQVVHLKAMVLQCSRTAATPWDARHGQLRGLDHQALRCRRAAVAGGSRGRLHA